ncbi:MAG: hypothetical protein AMK69_08890 [Nitrospira bacterium SG8_3]|nr:MAG: hypothetical protein AMK69_08890 [Nitrospira bacterium SG8_3]
MIALIQLVSLLAFSTCLAMDFKPPQPAEVMHAIGRTDSLPVTFQRALSPGKDFIPVPVPKSGDWLAVHHETGQTFADFVAAQPDKPDRRRNKIYIQPLGQFAEDRSPPLEMLQAFGAAYFVMDVAILPAVTITGSEITIRTNSFSGKRQLLTGDVLILLQQRLPADAFCLMAITMEDLYPHPSWNFVFGQASPKKRVGVFSFARYDPAFYGEERRKDYQTILLRRSCRVLVHEMAHMFSLAHCIFFSCVMNGSNHLQESEARPLSLCPVCLRKLQFSIGFDVVDRYRALLLFYQKAGLDHEAKWVSSRLKTILADDQER